MSKFERVLSDDELWAAAAEVEWQGTIGQYRLIEQAVLAKLAEQEPVAWVHPDDPTRSITHHQKLGAIKDGGAIEKTTQVFSIPAYTHPYVTPVIDKAACVSENGGNNNRINGLSGGTLTDEGTIKHLSYLKLYQKWRRGEDKTMGDMGLTPKHIGEALDWLIGVADDHIADASKMVSSDHIADMRNMIPEYAGVYVGDGLFSICDWQDWDSIKGYKWSLSTRNRSGCLYAQTKVDNGDGTRSRLAMHHAILPQKDGFVIDHINGNGLDNRRRNLRYATVQQNSFNQKIRKASSIYKGVSFDKESGSWRATIGVNGKKIYGGRHETELEAAKAYDEMAKKHFGKFAVLNLDWATPVEAVPKPTP